MEALLQIKAPLWGGGGGGGLKTVAVNIASNLTSIIPKAKQPLNKLKVINSFFFNRVQVSETEKIKQVLASVQFNSRSFKITVMF